MLWNKLIGPMQRRFRRQRARKILDRFPQINGGIVIDIGGSLAFWKEVEDILRPSRILIYNIDDGRMKMGVASTNARIQLHLYDGLIVPQPDAAADIVICNSVIEHVPPHLRAGLAAEVIRVGKSFVVQTPAREFPLELHFGLPFVHWLPRAIARQIVRVSPFAVLAKVDAKTYFDETRLLSRDEMAGYFPKASIEIEYLLGIPKSMLAFG